MHKDVMSCYNMPMKVSMPLSMDHNQWQARVFGVGDRVGQEHGEAWFILEIGSALPCKTSQKLPALSPLMCESGLRETREEERRGDKCLFSTHTAPVLAHSRGAVLGVWGAVGRRWCQAWEQGNRDQPMECKNPTPTRPD